MKTLSLDLLEAPHYRITEKGVLNKHDKYMTETKGSVTLSLGGGKRKRFNLEELQKKYFKKDSISKIKKQSPNSSIRGRFNHPSIKNGSMCFTKVRGIIVKVKLLYCNRNSSEYCVVEYEGKKIEKSINVIKINQKQIS